MTKVSAQEAKNHLSQLLDRVAKGEKILITRRGQPAALLAPPPGEPKKNVSQIIEEFKAYSKKQGRTLGGLTFREMIEEGRRY